MRDSPQVVILAGGLGTRLRPITEKIPKPMVEVAGHPFLHWQLEDVKKQGFRRILLLTSYLSEVIENYYGNGEKMGLEIRYSREPEPLGTGGALRLAANQLEDEFVLLNGDTFLEAPLMEMCAYFKVSQCAALIAAFGRPEVVGVPPNLKLATDSPGPVLAHQKQTQAGLTHVDAGIYVIDKTKLSPILESMREDRFGLSDLWPPLLERQAVHAFPVTRKFFDIGTPDRLKEFEQFLRGKK